MIKLTPAERNVIQLLVFEGLTQKQIALRLDLHQNTIKIHFRHIRSKAGAGTLYQAVAVAVARGWVCAPTIDPARGGGVLPW